MDDNTVFNNPPPNQPPRLPTSPVDTPLPPPVQSQLPPVPPLPLPPITPQELKPPVPPSGFVPPPFQPVTSPQEEYKRFNISKILKIAGVFLGLVVLFFLITTFVLPLFSKKESGTVTLVYWGLWENENSIKSVISDFEKQNPHIKITYEKQDIRQYRDRLTTRIQNGTGPDIFRFHNTWFPMFSNSLAPISSDVIKKGEFEKNYYPVIQQDIVKNGAIYGIPLGIDVLALYINKDIFSAAGLDIPTTWDAFASVSRKLTVKDEQGKIKTAGAAIGTFDNINHAPDIISLLLVQNGADIKNLSGTSQNASDALSFYTSFASDLGNVWDETLDPSLLMFAKGSLAMYFGFSWDVFAIQASNPALPFEIHPVPHLPNRNTTIASYWVEGVSARSTHQKEAMQFMKFLSKQETQQKLFTVTSKTRLFGEPYARIDLAESLKDNQYVYPFVAQAKDASSSFFAANTHDNGLNSQMNVYLGNAVRSILNGDSPQTAVDTLSKGVSQVLGQYGK